MGGHTRFMSLQDLLSSLTKVRGHESTCCDWASDGCYMLCSRCMPTRLEFQPGVSGLTWCIAQDADSEVQRGEFTGSTLQMGVSENRGP